MVEIKVTCDHCGDRINKAAEDAYKKISIGKDAFCAHLCDCCENVLIERAKDFCIKAVKKMMPYNH
jgi:hypothetical protein